MKFECATATEQISLARFTHANARVIDFIPSIYSQHRSYTRSIQLFRVYFAFANQLFLSKFYTPLSFTLFNTLKNILKLKVKLVEAKMNVNRGISSI